MQSAVSMHLAMTSYSTPWILALDEADVEQWQNSYLSLLAQHKLWVQHAQVPPTFQGRFCFSNAGTLGMLESLKANHFSKKGLMFFTSKFVTKEAQSTATTSCNFPLSLLFI